MNLQHPENMGRWNSQLCNKLRNCQIQNLNLYMEHYMDPIQHY